jgi:S1-C subfamily serine protease
MTPSIARAVGSSVDHGALIVDVKAGSPAARAGLHGGSSEVNVLGIQNLVTGGDVIVAIDGMPVRRADDVVRVVSSSLNPNDVAVFSIIRDGHLKKVAVTLAERRLPTG